MKSSQSLLKSVLTGGRWFEIACIGLSLLFLTAKTARANAGPHGGYTVTTDACAGCHRAHTAAAPSLLIDAVPNLCFTCHGSSATGADTNVTDGVYEGVGGGNLLAGGFVNYQGTVVTSAHSVNGTYQNAWGSGATWASTYDCAGCHNPESGMIWPGAPTWGISPNAWPTFPGRGQNVTMPLTCTSCHEPHGGPNYRLLKREMHWPIAWPMVPAPVSVTSNETGGQDPDLPGYVPDYTSPLYRDGMGDFCIGCHMSYHDEISINLFNAEDGRGRVRRYRHAVDVPLSSQTTTLPLEDLTGNGSSADDELFCVSCHFAHGSNVAMTGLAADVAPTNDSALLRLENRGVCEDCHQK